MELNLENLTALVRTAQDDQIRVLDQWPGKHLSSAEHFFVMHAQSETLLNSAPSTAVISSRLPKILDSHRPWFDAIRTVGVKLGKSQEVFLTGVSTAAHDCCLRLAELFSIDCLSIEQLSFENFRKIVAKEESLNQLATGRVFCVTQQKTKTDQTLAQLADTVFALSVGKNGNAEAALVHRLANCDPPSKTYLRNDNSMIPRSVSQPLLELGAIDWLLMDSTDETKPVAPSAGNYRKRTLPDLDQSEYLVHWTRARSGAWPDQSSSDYWDDLIFATGGHKHSDVFALCRILASRRIIASANLTRDSAPVVCFSDVPLGKLRDKTVFRKHLHRWDFLPYGIAIKRSVLQARFDCRQVIYGDEKTWESMADSDRPFFQLKETTNKKIHWQEESEWRVVGDVNLRNIELSNAIVFAGDEMDLEKLSQLSLFDLIVI